MPVNDPRDNKAVEWLVPHSGRVSQRLITSYQLLPFNSELAATTLKALAATQGKNEVELTEEEPAASCMSCGLGS